MKDPNLEYLNNNFLTLEQVSQTTGVAILEIENRIRNGQLPEPSYRLNRKVEITSPLGDKHVIEETTLYFPPSYIGLVKQNAGETAEIKRKFIDELRVHFGDHPSKDFAYDGAAVDGQKLDAALEHEWESYSKGIYGICTLNATPAEIIGKEIAVKRLIAFLNSHSDGDLKDNESEFAKIVEEYDKVSNLFAPYQRETSSRGKYVDKPLRLLKLEDKVRKYQEK